MWTRCILIDEYGLDSSKVTWVVDDEEHVTQLQAAVRMSFMPPAGRSLADMMAEGELAAGFHGNAGVGRSGSPTGGWKTVEADYPDLFPNAAELEAAWYARTGIYPMHGTIVVKDAVLAEHPWVAQVAVRGVLARERRMACTTRFGRRHQRFRQEVRSPAQDRRA